MYIKIRIWSY